MYHSPVCILIWSHRLQFWAKALSQWQHLKSLFPCLCSWMLYKWTNMWKSFATLGSLIWFLPSVCSKVLLPLKKGLCTHLTYAVSITHTKICISKTKFGFLKWEQVIVVYHSTHLYGYYVRKIFTLTSLFCFFLRMHLQICYKMNILWKSFTTLTALIWLLSCVSSCGS